MARAKEATSGKSFMDDSALGFDQSDSPCIMVSGDSDEIGTIRSEERRVGKECRL